MARANTPKQGSGRRVSVGILLSGSGSNMQALVAAAKAGVIPAKIRVVISNNPDAYGLERAALENIPGVVVDHRDYDTREDFENALSAVLDEHQVEVVCLAGFMRMLTGTFLEKYPHRVLNVHPGLLPAFPGLHGAEQALSHGVKVAGCTVHLVTEEMDAGPIVAQAAVPVYDDDTEETLTARIQAEEHRIFPLALGWLCEGRCRVDGRRVRLLEAQDG